jgi:hypothetical protein
MEAYTVQNVTTQNGVTIYGVNVNFTSGSQGSFPISFIVATNNTVLSLSFDGFNETGSQASTFLSELLGFTFYLQGSGPYAYLIQQNVLTKVNTTSVTLGPTTMTVSNYQPSSLPYTYTACGQSITMQKFDLQAGSVPKTNFGSIITYLSLQGTVAGSTGSVTFQVTSITPAS